MLALMASVAIGSIIRAADMATIVVVAVGFLMSVAQLTRVAIAFPRLVAIVNIARSRAALALMASIAIGSMIRVGDMATGAFLA